MDGDPEQVLGPADIQTLEELARGFTTLAGTRTRVSLTETAAALPVRDGRQPALPKSTLSDLLGGKSMPQRDTVVTFLTVCGLSTAQDQQPWLVAWERVSNAHLRRPAGAVRVRDARARLLGVHAAIRADLGQSRPGNPKEVDSGTVGVEDKLPVYVPRDLDVDLRTKLTVARECGGFVLLTGDSSVGKTRALFQAVRDVVPEWWLLHPADAPAVCEFANAPTDRTVVWLDELQNYLNHTAGLPAAAITRLVSAGTVLVATLWPGDYAIRAAPRNPGQPDRYANDRQLLGLADIVAVSGEFSTAERRRAEDLADTDRRIRIALDTPDAGVTQVMAAGPQLIHHWEHAPADQCYGKAIITAALDARRVGAQSPVTRDYLATAAPGYLTDRQQATAPHDWFDRAVDYATKLLKGATATLSPIAAGMGQTAGYRTADYLHQHALRVRRCVHLPDAAWHALVQHHHPDDTERLIDSARRRGRPHEVETLYRQLANSGDGSATNQLANLMLDQGRVDDATVWLRARADNGDTAAGDRLADLLAEHSRPDEAINRLHARADNGDTIAGDRLADLLAEHSQVDEAINRLRARADNGDTIAGDRLADLLAEHGQVDEAIDRLGGLADAGNPFAADRLASLLAQHDRVDDLAHRADNGDTFAAFRLIDLLAEHGQVDEAIDRLRTRADNGDTSAAFRLIDLLAELGQVDELASLADNGDRFAADRLIDLQTELSRADEVIDRLRARADNGDLFAAFRLANLLAEQGGVDEATDRLRPLADDGNAFAADRLIDLLAEHGQVDEAIDRLRTRADNGDTLAAVRMANLLAEQGGVDEVIDRLRALADNGDPSAADRLIDLLAEHDRVDELAHRADNGDTFAGDRLADLLAEQGRVDDLAHRANNGDTFAGIRLADLLAEQGRVDEATDRLRALADNGDTFAADRLIDLLAEHGQVDEATDRLRPRADNGDPYAAEQLTALLRREGRIEELEAEVAAGTAGAVDALHAVRSRVSNS